MAATLSLSAIAKRNNIVVVVPNIGKSPNITPNATERESWCGVIPCFKNVNKGFKSRLSNFAPKLNYRDGTLYPTNKDAVLIHTKGLIKVTFL